MARKRIEINPICGQRAKELLKNSSISQGEFASRINYTEQHLSQVLNGKKTLTDEMADKFCEFFPDVRKEWLLGYDDFKTNADFDFFVRKHREKEQSAWEKYSAIEKYLFNLGYDFSSDGKTITLSSSSGEKAEIDKATFFNSLNSISTYAEFVIAKMMKGEINNG